MSKKLLLEDLLKKEKPVSYSDIKTYVGFNKKTAEKELNDLKEKGYNIGSYLDNNYNVFFYLEKNKVNVYDTGLKNTNGIVSICSDLHYGDRQCREDSINKYFDMCQDRGAQAVLDAGDLTTGVSVYRGQHSDLKLHTIDEQIDYVIENLPVLSGVKHYVVAGNHDLDSLKNCGVNPISIIARSRKDIENVGDVVGKVIIGGLEWELNHYQGSTPYSLSYRAQKYIRNLNPKQMPNVEIMGHMHSCLYAVIQNVHCFEAMTFQDETNFTKSKGLQSVIGGWILEYNIIDGVLKLKPECITF